MLGLVWFERSLSCKSLQTKLPLTLKTDDVTSGRRDVDSHSQLIAVQGQMGK